MGLRRNDEGNEKEDVWKEKKEAKKDTYREDRYRRYIEGEIRERDKREGHTERGNRCENRLIWEQR